MRGDWYVLHRIYTIVGHMKSPQITQTGAMCHRGRLRESQECPVFQGMCKVESYVVARLSLAIEEALEIFRKQLPNFGPNKGIV